jgi:conjugative relaxase-like TrwC/TraI family protein
MFTMAKIVDGSSYLGNHLVCNDYYCEGEKISGRWVGKGAVQMGLKDEIEAGNLSFESLRQNINPATGDKLTPRSPTVKFFDFQCSGQKSVSLVAILMDDRRLVAAHDAACAKAFGELEKFSCCRVRDGSLAWSEETRLTGNVVAAAFRHDASRALDPQLHTHFVVANCTWDESKKRWVALNEYEMVKAIRYAGKTYQNEMARHCLALGYDIELIREQKRGVTGFEINGVSEDLRERFGKRRAEVEKGITEFTAKYGYEPSAAEISAITKATRSAKLAEISTPEVRQMQLDQLSRSEIHSLEKIKQDAIEKAAAKDLQLVSGQEGPYLRRSVEHLFERKSVQQGHEILAEALNVGLGRVDLDELHKKMEDSPRLLVGLSDSSANPLLSAQFATPKGLAVEKWAVGMVDAGRETQPILGRDGFEISSALNTEQQAAVKTILFDNRDQVTAIRGVAGAGKTTALTELHRGLTDADNRVFYLAPTTAAVKVLKQEGFSNAVTVSRFLTSTWKHEDLRGAVFIVDEAGLQSNRQGASVLKLVQKNNARVLLVGDTRQHVSVEAGDFLRVLEKYSRMRTVELTDIQRQKVFAYREAVKTMSQGMARQGLEELDSLGWVKESGPDYLKAAATDYLNLSADPKKTVILVVPTWEENYRLTDSIREGLKAQGKLGTGHQKEVLEPLQWTTAQRRDAASYQPGMKVKFNLAYDSFRQGETLEVCSVSDGNVTARNRLGREKVLPVQRPDVFETFRPRQIEVAAGDKLLVRENQERAGLINGEVLTVSGFEKDGGVATLEGKIIPAKCRALAHGYALTSYKAQGRTADHVIVAAGQMDSKTCYVACSRGRESCMVHTPSIENLMNHLPPSKTGDRKAALEALSPILPAVKMVSTGAVETTTKISLAGLVIGNRATVWETMIPKPVSTAVNRVAQLGLPGLGQIQGLISLAQMAHEWSRRLTVKKEIERELL